MRLDFIHTFLHYFGFGESWDTSCSFIVHPHYLRILSYICLFYFLTIREGFDAVCCEQSGGMVV